MRRVTGILVLTAILAMVVAVGPTVVSAQLPIPSAGTYDRSLEIHGIERTYRVHVPPTQAPAEGMPVLIVLHGGAGNGKQVELTSGFSELADQEGFIAVYPDGSGRLPRRLTWNAYNCCAFAAEKDIDGVAFISDLIDHVVADFHADPARVYVTGHSNGAMMSFRLACELSDKIAAAAPYAGALNTDTCAPSSAVPILIMNGEDDSSVRVEGGKTGGYGSDTADARIDNPTSYAVDVFTAADGCSSAPTVEDTAASLVRSWTECSHGSAVEQMLIHGWGHEWPLVRNGAPFDASPVIWDFVSRFSKPQQLPAATPTEVGQ